MGPQCSVLSPQSVFMLFVQDENISETLILVKKNHFSCKSLFAVFYQEIFHICGGGGGGKKSSPKKRFFSSSETTILYEWFS